MFARLMGLPVISPKELHERMRTEPIHVIDVNAETRWLAARVPGARHLDPLSFAAGDLPADRDAVIVFYCSNPLCRKAPNAARRARDMGYRDVRVMSAGISGWLGASLPTDSGAPRTASG
jgi:rhodanese-related sulfurtransferase